METRKILFWGHLAGGVVAGIFIFIKAVTGILLTFEPQIVALAERPVRTVKLDSMQIERMSLETVLGKLQNDLPGRVPNTVTIGSSVESSVAFNYGRGKGTYFVNPYTAQILGQESRAHQYLHKVEDFHRWFGFKPVGKPLSGIVTIIFFCLCLSGVYLWWPRKTVKLNSNLSGKARDWNWHNVFGFWMLPILLVITSTGVVMAFGWANNLLFRLTGNEPPPMVQRDQNKQKEPFTDVLPLDILYARASQQLPDWKSLTLRLPQTKDANLVVFIEEPHTFGPVRRSQLTMNPLTAEIIKWEPYSEANSGRKARAWARYLHTGEVGGLPGQVIAGIAAGAAAMLVWTGIAMAWRRWRKIA